MVSPRRTQAVGPIGFLVDRMIRRSVRRTFHTVWWQPPVAKPADPCIFVCNHHGWHDGYLMYHVVTKLGAVSLDWVAEFDAFPLFRFVGGLPFPQDRQQVRAATIRRTVRKMKDECTNLILFAEGELHRPPGLLPFGRSLELLAKRVPGCTILPVAIRYEMSLHERPEAFIGFGKPIGAAEAKPEKVRLCVSALLDRLQVEIGFRSEGFEVLCAGTRDVNERWDMRKLPGSR